MTPKAREADTLVPSGGPETLEGYLARRGPIPLSEAVAMTRPLAADLDAAHRRGLCHKGLGPANLTVRGEAAEVWLDDEHLARPGEAPPKAAASQSLCSPEEQRGDPDGPAADRWSFAALLYRMVADSSPFPGSPASRRRRVEAGEVAALPDLGLAGPRAAALDAAFRRGMAPAAAARPASCMAFLDLLVGGGAPPAEADRPAASPGSPDTGEARPGASHPALLPPAGGATGRGRGPVAAAAAAVAIAVAALWRPAPSPPPPRPPPGASAAIPPHPGRLPPGVGGAIPPIPGRSSAAPAAGLSSAPRVEGGPPGPASAPVSLGLISTRPLPWGAPRAAAVDPETGDLLLGGGGPEVALVDGATGAVRWRHRADAAVRAVCFAGPGEVAYSTARTIDLPGGTRYLAWLGRADGARRHRDDGGGGAPRALAWDPGQSQLWEVGRSSRVRVFTGPDRRPEGIPLPSPDPDFVAVAIDTVGVAWVGDVGGRVWRLEEPPGPRAPFAGMRGRLTTVAANATDQVVVTGWKDGDLVAFDRRSRAIRWHSKGAHPGGVRAARHLPGTPWLMTGGAGGELRVWDRKSGESRGAYPAEGGAIVALGPGPDGRVVAVAADGQARVYQLGGS